MQFSTNFRTTTSLFGLLAIALLLTVFAPSGHAQEEQALAEEAPAQDDFQFDEIVNVSVVNVDVWVRDKQGNPIKGLTADDFEITENDRPVAITNFYAVEGGAPVAGARDTDVSELAIHDDDPLRLIPEEQRLSLIVYVDNFNIRPFNRNRVFRRLREFLHDELNPGDRAMLASYDRSIHVRHPFTTDPTLIANATFDLEKLTGFAVHRDSDRRDLLRDIEEAESLGEIQWRVRQHAESQFNDLSFTLSALHDFVDTLAGLPGRKAILYVSDGLEMVSAEDLYFALSYKFQQTSMMAESYDFNANRKFKALAAAANTNRVTFYTIDAAGLRVHSSASAEKATANPIAGMDSAVDSTYISNHQSTLQYLAEETGGFAIINTNDIGTRLPRVASDFSDYYSLGYAPPHAGDGRYYDIEVKLKGGKKRNGKKLTIRHREGYRDKTTYARMADGTTSNLRYGLGKNPLSIEIALGDWQKEEKHFLVPISVMVPLDQVVLIEQNDVYFGRLKLFFSAMDAEGDLSEVQEVPLQLRIPADQLEAAKSLPFRLVQTQLQMRSGGHRVAVGVRDELGANESFVTREVIVGS